MKIFANNDVWKKIVIVLLVIFSISFIEPIPVNAGIGGALMEPICDFLVGLADGWMGLMHEVLLHQHTTLIRIDTNGIIAAGIRIAVTIIITLVILAAICVATGGIGVVGAALAKGVAVSFSTKAITFAVLASLGTVVPLCLKTGLYVGTAVYNWEVWNNEIDLPLYSLTPQSIFTNQIPLFDVNFFNPDERRTKYDWVRKVDYIDAGKEALAQNVTANGEYKETAVASELKEKIKNNGEVPTNASDYWKVGTGNPVVPAGATTKIYTENDVTYIYKSWTDQSGNHETILVKNDSNDKNESSEKDGVHSLSYDLSDIISKWYYSLRTFAIVGMMTVLVYIGIRILLSSTSSQKSKYKQLLGDWFIGMVLLFTLHYIMIFSNIFVENLTATLTRYNPSVHVPFVEDKLGVIEKELKEYNIQTTTSASDAEADPQKVYIHKEGDKSYIEWHTDLMGHIRLKVRENQGKDEIYVGYTIMFLVIVFYVTFFVFTYLKRVILMAFLTIIAPLVALTYPIDKANDGQAQGFNFWFKEYIFNLLLQPMHLLIYTILVSSALDLATRNWIYSLVALGFIASAEKLVRQMFNFSKASTPGVFAGPAGAAMVMSGMRWLFGHGPRGPHGGPGRGALGNGDADSEDNGITSSGQGPNLQQRLNAFLGDTNNNGQESHNHTGARARNGASNTNSNHSTLGLMREAEEEQSFLPSQEQLGMWDNDIRFEDNLNNQNDGYQYSDEEYEQVLRDSGYSDEQIAEIMGGSDGGNSLLTDMRDVEETESIIPTQEQLGMWENDINYENGNSESKYSDEEYEQILRDSGYSREDISSIMGRRSAASDNLSESFDSINPNPVIQDRSAMATEGSSGIITEDIAGESTTEANSGLVESSMLITPSTTNNNGIENKNDKWSRAREYIESKESGEAIDRRRINEKIRERENEKNAKKENSRRIRNEIMDKYKDRARRRVGESLQNGQPIRNISKAIGGVMGAATAGTVGLAAGIASGDVKNVTTYTVAGVAGGAKLGSSLTEANQRRISEATKDLADTYERATLGNDEYKAKKAYENQMKAAHNEKNIEFTQRKTGKSRSETKKYLEEIFPEYMNADIKDIKDILILEKMADPAGKNTHGRTYSRDDAILAYKVRKKSGVDNNDKQKALDRIEADYGVNRDGALKLYAAAKDLDRLYAE